MIDIKELRQLTKETRKVVDAEVDIEVFRVMIKIESILCESARSGYYSERVLLFGESLGDTPVGPAIKVERVHRVAEGLARDLTDMGFSVIKSCASECVELDIDWSES